MKKKTNYNKISSGYYDFIYKKKSGIQSAWHHVKFNFVGKKIFIKALDNGQDRQGLVAPIYIYVHFYTLT